MSALELVRRMKHDMPFFAEQNLKIIPKSTDPTAASPVIPLKLNRAQQYIHDEIEKQLAETGRVRAVILKGRQQGCSTYIAARFYHRSVTNEAMRVFIFAHDADGSDTLFNMVKDYYELSHPRLRPQLGKSNAKELLFPELKSGYRVGTAGTKGLGRSKTIRLLHWSEVAYSPNCDDHASGILETVAELPGTEIIWESTANGQGNYFHRLVRQAQAGESGVKLIFVPWYWQDEYTMPVPEGNVWDEEEETLLSMYGSNGLTHEHLIWRRLKIKGKNGDVLAFMREYPNSVTEAFAASDEDSYIGAAIVQQARLNPPVSTTAGLVIGIDPARFGNDSIGFCHRKGRNVLKYGRWPQMDTVALANRIIQEIANYKPAKVFIDAGNTGAGVYDILRDRGYGNVCEMVNFGGKANNPDRYANKRAEMYGNARDWLMDVPCSIHEDNLEAGDELQADITSVRYRYNSNQALILEPKEEIKKRNLPSPDLADAFVLTFAQPIGFTDDNINPAHAQTIVANTGYTGW